MAIYPYKCSICGSGEEVVQSISSYTKDPIRPECCDIQMDRVFTVPMMSMDFEPFISPIDGSIINSRSSRREHMLKHGVVPTDEIAPDVERNKKRMQERAKADVKQDIVTAFQMADQGYKPRLETEVIPGA